MCRCIYTNHRGNGKKDMVVYVCIGSREFFELRKTEFISLYLLFNLLVCIRNQDIYIGNPSLFDDDVSPELILADMDSR